MKIKFQNILILTSLFLMFFTTVYATETKNNLKLDSLLVSKNLYFSPKDSTRDYKKPMQTSAIIGFTASLVSILSWIPQIWGFYTIAAIFNPLIFGIIGLAFSIVALHKIKKSGKKGKGLAKAGIIMTILHALGLIALLALVLFSLSKFSF